MTRRQLNKLAMLLVLNEYFASNIVLVKTVPELESITAAINSLITGIQSASEQQIINRTGASDSKRLIKAELIANCADIARKLTAYAFINGNMVLLYESKTSDYKLSRLTDEKLASACGLIFDLGTQHLPAATAYDLDQKSLTKLDSDIKTFVEAIPKPRLSKIYKKLETEKLVALFHQAEELLVKSDLLVGIVKLSQPNFFAGYKSARVIVDRVGRGLQLKITVVDQSDGKAVKGAWCQLVPENATDKSGLLSRKSAAKGSTNFKSLDEGRYMLTVRKSGYGTKNQIVTVVKGEFERVVAGLDRLL